MSPDNHPLASRSKKVSTKNCSYFNIPMLKSVFFRKVFILEQVNL